MTAPTPAPYWSRWTKRGAPRAWKETRNHPVTRGFLCGKVAKYLDRVYSPAGCFIPCGAAIRRPRDRFARAARWLAFERISLGRGAGDGRAAAGPHQPQVRIRKPSCLIPTRAPSACSAMARWIAASFTASARRSWTAPSVRLPAAKLCSPSTAASWAPIPSSFAMPGTSSPGAPTSTGTIFICGRLIEEARRNGAKLVVIDPYHTRTARAADWHLAHQSRHRCCAGAGHDAHHHRRRSL